MAGKFTPQPPAAHTGNRPQGNPFAKHDAPAGGNPFAKKTTGAPDIKKKGRKKAIAQLSSDSKPVQPSQLSAGNDDGGKPWLA